MLLYLEAKRNTHAAAAKSVVCAVDKRLFVINNAFVRYFIHSFISLVFHYALYYVVGYNGTIVIRFSKYVLTKPAHMEMEKLHDFLS